MNELSELPLTVDEGIAVVATPAPAGGGTSRQRIPYIDNLHILLTVLVVVHHAAVGYSDIPLWYYNEPPTDRSSVILDVLLILDQSFFMGFFFLLSGYFVPTSYDHKGGREFLRDRLIRLGIPLALFAFLLRPVLEARRYASVSAEAAAKGAELSYWRFYLSSWNPGPLWFVEVLLVFCAVYALARRFLPRCAVAPPASAARTRPARHFMAAILGYSLTLALLTCLWRTVVPAGQFWPILGLPTPAYMPQYATLFVVGLVACRRGWAQALPVSAGWYGLAQALVATLLVALVAVLARTVFAANTRTWAPSAYAIWESLFAAGVIVALLVLYHQKVNHQGPLASFMSAHCYAVYIIHPLVLVGLGYALRWLHTIAVLKFAILTAFAVPLCWLVAAMVRAIPHAKRVI